MELEDIIDKHYGELLRFACRHSRDSEEALDAVQEACARLIEKGQHIEPARIRPWLFRVVYNCCMDRRRRYIRWIKGLTGFGRSTERLIEILDPVDELLKKEKETMIEKALSRMSEKHSTPLVLRYYHDMAYQEIAEVLDIAIGTVMSRLHRARAELASHIASGFYMESCSSGNKAPKAAISDEAVISGVSHE